MLLLVFYSVAAWFSLFWINAILSFPLARGDVAFTRQVWWGFCNPSSWPWLLYRTIASMAIAALAACVVINFTGSLEREARRELIGQVCVFLGPLLLMPLLGIWFLASMPFDRRSLVLGDSVTMTILVGGAVASTVIGAYALAALRYRRLSINGFAATLFCVIAFAATAMGEFVREGVREPYSIREVLYSHPKQRDGLEQLQETRLDTEEPSMPRNTSKERP